MFRIRSRGLLELAVDLAFSGQANRLGRRGAHQVHLFTNAEEKISNRANKRQTIFAYCSLSVSLLAQRNGSGGSALMDKQGLLKFSDHESA